MKRKTYYDVPIQVRFWVDDAEGMGRGTLTGIAYRNQIICACCGVSFF